DINLIKKDSSHIYLEAGAGLNWDDFVKYCIDQNLSGLENLSNIPGNIGASPVQNIGAYGVEVKEFIESVQAIDLITGDSRSFTNIECEFGYRTSIFKKELSNRFLIQSVIFRLNKTHKFNLEYEGIVKELAESEKISLTAIRNAIIKLRNAKLPDHKKTGTAGSFFKNPVVSHLFAEDLKKEYPSLKYYETPNQMAKLAAGWLIEQCGWKGKKIANAGVYDKQALVLVNHGKATGLEILELSQKIQESVYTRFGIQLQPEVKII
ncbi:UDP-N-acetylmuramate dehydrogenase, partial [Bacteroidota bacterium]